MKNGIIFPRYAEDITSMRRTLFHDVEGDYTIGEPLCIIAAAGVHRGYAAIVVDVKRTRLADLTVQDEAKLNCSKEDYLARWVALGCAADAEVFAIEFRYGSADQIAAAP